MRCAAKWPVFCGLGDFLTVNGSGFRKNVFALVGWNEIAKRRATWSSRNLDRPIPFYSHLLQGDRLPFAPRFFGRQERIRPRHGRVAFHELNDFMNPIEPGPIPARLPGRLFGPHDNLRIESPWGLRKLRSTVSGRLNRTIGKDSPHRLRVYELRQAID